MNQTMQQQSSAPKRTVARKRARLLNCERSALWEERFQDFNTKYFKGRLPKYEVYLCSDGCLDGQCISEKKQILIIEDMLFRRTLALLLHEMIHIKISWHGDRFVKEWNRIRAMGAPIGKWDSWPGDLAPIGHLKLNRQNARDAIRHYLREPYPMEGYLYHADRVPNLTDQLETEFSMPGGTLKKKVNIPELLKETERELTEEAKVKLAKSRLLDEARFRRINC